MENKAIASAEDDGDENKNQNPLSYSIRAGKDGAITVTKCALCKSANRKEAETMFDQGLHISAIKKFLDEKSEAYAIWRIKHHFENHYKTMANEVAIAEYRDHLDLMMNRRRNMVDDMLRSIDIAWIELSNILVMPTNGDINKQQMRLRMISDLQRTIKEGHEFIKDLHDSETKAKAIQERFARVWEIKLEQCKDENEKKLIISTLKDFQEKLNQLTDT